MEVYAQNNTSSPIDFYPHITENSPEKIISLTISIVGIIIGPPILLSIIWFEKYGSDKKRTLINIIFAYCCWTYLKYIFLVEVFDVIRYIFGPLPATICYLKVIIRNTLGYIIGLYINATMVMRYAYIFWLKNPAAFEDEFWSTFIVIWTHTVSILSQLAWHFLLTYQPVEFYVCTGKDPEEMFKNPPKNFAIAEIFSTIANILLYSRIYFYKRKINKTNLVQVHQGFSSNTIKENEKRSFATIANYVIVIIYLAVSALIGLKLNSLKFEDIIQFPNSLFFHYKMLVSPQLGLTLIIATFYRNKNYVQLMKEEIKIFYCNICNQSVT